MQPHHRQLETSRSQPSGSPRSPSQRSTRLFFCREVTVLSRTLRPSLLLPPCYLTTTRPYRRVVVQPGPQHVARVELVWCWSEDADAVPPATHRRTDAVTTHATLGPRATSSCHSCPVCWDLSALSCQLASTRWQPEPQSLTRYGTTWRGT
jgi:hypothetical protein